MTENKSFKVGQVWRCKSQHEVEIVWISKNTTTNNAMFILTVHDFNSSQVMEMWHYGDGTTVPTTCNLISLMDKEQEELQQAPYYKAPMCFVSNHISCKSDKCKCDCHGRVKMLPVKEYVEYVKEKTALTPEQRQERYLNPKPHPDMIDAMTHVNFHAPDGVVQPKPIKIEVGRKYKTKSNEIITIVKKRLASRLYDHDKSYRDFHGWDITYYNSNGVCTDKHGQPIDEYGKHDIVAEYVGDIDIKVESCTCISKALLYGHLNECPLFRGKR